jgi:hypothetical protein
MESIQRNAASVLRRAVQVRHASPFARRSPLAPWVAGSTQLHQIAPCIQSLTRLATLLSPCWYADEFPADSGGGGCGRNCVRQVTQVQLASSGVAINSTNPGLGLAAMLVRTRVTGSAVPPLARAAGQVSSTAVRGAPRQFNRGRGAAADALHVSHPAGSLLLQPTVQRRAVGYTSSMHSSLHATLTGLPCALALTSRRCAPLRGRRSSSGRSARRPPASRPRPTLSRTRPPPRRASRTSIPRTSRMPPARVPLSARVEAARQVARAARVPVRAYAHGSRCSSRPRTSSAPPASEDDSRQ